MCGKCVEYSIFDLQVTLMLPTKFLVNWPFGSGEEAKNKFSRWPPWWLSWWLSWISDRKDFSYFWSTSHSNASYGDWRQNGLLVQEKNQKIDFLDGHHGGHLVFEIGKILAIFDLQVTPSLPTNFRVNWSFGSGEAKNRFSKWPPWQPFGISNQFDFSYFWSTSHPEASYQVSGQLAFRFRRKSEK